MRPVHRIKHVVDQQFAIPIGGANTVVELVKTVDAPVIGNTTEVETGSKVNGIYLHVEVVATTSAALPNVYMIVTKNQGNNLVFPAANAVGASDNKRFVIHQEMLMAQKQSGSNPRTLFNGVIVLPRGYRRMGPDDRVKLEFLSPGVIWDVCMQAHYKEFR